MNRDPLRSHPFLGPIRDESKPLFINHTHTNGDKLAEHLLGHLHWISPLSCAFLALGFFTNALSIGVFRHKNFDYMKLPVFMIIFCTLNMFFLATLTLKIYTCFLDHAKLVNGSADTSKYRSCIYVGWVSEILEYVAQFNLFVAVCNRIKSRSVSDVTSNAMNAKRIPLISLMATTVLSIVPATIFYRQKIRELEQIPLYRCSHLFVFPYNLEYTIGVVISIIHVLFEGAILVALVILGLIVAWGIFTKKKWISSRSTWLASVIDVPRLASFHTHDDASDYSLSFSRAAESSMDIKPESYFKDHSFSYMFIADRDASMTKLTASMTFVHVAVNMTKHLVQRHYDMRSHDEDHNQLSLSVMLAITSMIYYAAPLAIFMSSSHMFRQLVRRYFFERATPRKQYYTDMALARRMGVIKSYRDDIKDPEEEEKMKKYLIESFDETRARLNLENVVPSKGKTNTPKDRLFVRRRKFHSPNATTWL